MDLWSFKYQYFINNRTSINFCLLMGANSCKYFKNYVLGLANPKIPRKLMTQTPPSCILTTHHEPHQIAIVSIRFGSFSNTGCYTCLTTKVSTLRSTDPLNFTVNGHRICQDWQIKVNIHCTHSWWILTYFLAKYQYMLSQPNYWLNSNQTLNI